MIINYFKYRIVKQQQPSDCGPACLLSLIRYFGGRAYLDKLRVLCHTDYRGCRLYDLKSAAEKLGFRCSAYRIDKGRYPSDNLPVILHCQLPNYLTHYVIVYAVRKGRFLIGDPAKGLYWLDKKELDDLWESRILLTFDYQLPYRDPVYRSDWSWFWGYIRDYSDSILQIFFCGIISILAGFFTAFLMRTVTERVVPEQDWHLLTLSLIFLMAFLLLRSGAEYVRKVLFFRHGNSLFQTIFSKSFKHFIHLPYRLISRFTTGEMTARFLDLFRIQSFYHFTLLYGLSDLFILLGSIVVMYFFSPLLAGISALFVLLLGGTLVGFYPTLRRIQNTTLRKGAAFSQGLIETLEGLDEISALDVHSYFIHLNEDEFKKFLDCWKRVGLINSRILVFSEGFLGVFQLVFIGLGIRFVLKGGLTFGNWLAAFVLTGNFIPSVFRLMENALKGAEARESITRLRDFLIHPIEKTEGEQEIDRPDFLLDIQKCSFQWPKYQPLFEKVSFSVRKGSMIHILGENGTGKTTLIHAILQQYRFSEGNMYWNGKHVMQIDLTVYRSHFGVVTQEVKIFNMTLQDNIFLGRNVQNKTWLKEIFRDFNWFFQKFELGLFTLLGEGYRQLSGGEKQLVGLLRAILDEPDVLILDEGFNSLDTITQSWVLQWIKMYSENHAVIIISHDHQISNFASDVVSLDKETAG